MIYSHLLQGHRDLEPIQRSLGKRQGYNPDMSLVHHKATSRQIILNIQTYGQFKNNQSVFRLGVEVEVPGEMGTTCKVHRKSLMLRFEPGTFLLKGNSSNH